MRWLKAALFAALFGFLRCAGGPDVAGAPGTGQETTNGVVGAVRYSDGSPGAGALVRLRLAAYLSAGTIPADYHHGRDARADDSGRFFIDSLDTGVYSIEVNDGDSVAALFTAHLAVRTDTFDAGADTLRPYAVVSGVVDTAGQSGWQLYALVAGLERRAPVDPSGRFALADLPAGIFDLRFAAGASAPFAEAANVHAVSGGTSVLRIKPDYRYSRLVYLNTTPTGANVLQDVFSFPICISLDSANFDFSQTRIDGYDLRFAKPDGTPLQFHLDTWDYSLHRAAVWALVDTVFGNRDDQYITMMWGNPAALDAVSPGAVFDTANGFAGVWHLTQHGMPDSLLDATWRDSHAQPAGDWTHQAVVDGIIGWALQFDGSGDYCISGRNVHPLDTGNATISAWIKTADAAHNKSVISYGAGDMRLRLIVQDYAWFGLYDGAAWIDTFTSRTMLADDQWHYVAVTYDRAGSATAYVDGAAEAAIDISAARNAILNADSITIGFDNYSLPSYWIGLLDEVRFESTARSASWIRLCFENQRKGQRLLDFR
jgi:hypothetical protein